MTVTNYILSLMLTISIICQMVLGSHYYVKHTCPHHAHFTNNDPFKQNLENLLSDLIHSKTPEKGYSFHIVGSGSDFVYGHALCRGDISQTVCNNCLAKAGHYIRLLCPNKKQSVIWYEKCLLKYSDDDFFGEVDRRNWFIVLENSRLPASNMLFKQKKSELLTRLANQASKNGKKFAIGKVELDEQDQLFGLAQCTRDLSRNDCEECFDMLLLHQTDLIQERMGAYVISGSCVLRYDTNKFTSMLEY